MPTGLDKLTVVMTQQQESDINISVKLHINQRLFDNGHITEDLYQRAKEIIIKG